MPAWCKLTPGDVLVEVCGRRYRGNFAGMVASIQQVDPVLFLFRPAAANHRNPVRFHGPAVAFLFGCSNHTMRPGW